MVPKKVDSPMDCTVVEVCVTVGQIIQPGQPLVVVEAMKMEHVILCTDPAVVAEVMASAGEVVACGATLITLTPSLPAQMDASRHATAAAPQEGLRPDLLALRAREALIRDSGRPEAVAKRHERGLRTARENIESLCDPGSFLEYGALAIAAQQTRRSPDDLQRNTPADGLVTGIGSVNQASFPGARSRCVVMAYDATVLAGTQGFRNHQKTDRMLRTAMQQRLPVVLFAEGGGGRPGDVDMPIVAGLHVASFAAFSALSGRVPLVGVAAGRCFAGNAALLSCCDVVIATTNSNIGMGGPAMVEGAGLGRFAPEDIGPSGVQAANGVIDVLVEDEVQAAAAARRYLSYFQGPTAGAAPGDPAALRSALPSQRNRSYDMRGIVHALADLRSVFELRQHHGQAILTFLARIEGRPVGIVANNPQHLGGAIDPQAADKYTLFIDLCNAHGLAILSLIDTPGFMVGPAVEAQAQVHHVGRMFIASARLRVPYFAIVLRKAYGLGAMAMAAGGFQCPVFTAAWPSGEFGAMGVEGAVKLGFRKELEAVPPGEPRESLFRRLVAEQHAKGSALNMATTLEIDAVIDPAASREWVSKGLASSRIAAPSSWAADA